MKEPLVIFSKDRFEPFYGPHGRKVLTGHVPAKSIMMDMVVEGHRDVVKCQWSHVMKGKFRHQVKAND